MFMFNSSHCLLVPPLLVGTSEITAKKHQKYNQAEFYSKTTTLICEIGWI